MVTVRRDLVDTVPDLIAELLRMFRDAKALAPPAGDREALPVGRAAAQPALALALRYAEEQGLLPRRLGIEEVWEGLPGDVA